MKLDKGDRIYILEWTKQQYDTIRQMVYEYIMICDDPNMQGYSNGHHWIPPDLGALQNLYNCIVDAETITTWYGSNRYRLELSHKERIQLTEIWANLTNWYLDHKDSEKQSYLSRDEDAWLRYKSVRKKTMREATYEESVENGYISMGDVVTVREGEVHYEKEAAIR